MRKTTLFFACASFLLAAIASPARGDDEALPEIRGGDGKTTRFAYTSIFYTGTPRDWEYFCALRVMYETVRRTGTPYDRVAIVADDVPQWIYDRLQKDGIKTTTGGTIPNPYENRPDQAIYQDRFVKVFNKLLAWKLEQYDRVMLLDSDLLFLQNTDELFFCGSFCAIYVNPCIFHTGMVGLKPSRETLKDMIEQFPKLESYDGGDQGFLNSYYEKLLGAPLFDPKKYDNVEHPTTRELTAEEDQPKRLAFGYHLDHFYFYQRMRWEVPCSEKKVVGFPGIANFKPWYWWTWPFLPLSLNWHAVCSSLDECGASTGELSLHAFAAIALAVGSFKVPTLALSARIPLLWRLLLSWFLMLVVPIKLLPTVMHPYMGWPLYFAYGAGILLMLARALSLPPRAAFVWVAAAAGIVVQGWDVWPTVVTKFLALVAHFILMAVVITYGVASAKKEQISSSPSPENGPGWHRLETVETVESDAQVGQIGGEISRRRAND